MHGNSSVWFSKPRRRRAAQRLEIASASARGQGLVENLPSKICRPDTVMVGPSREASTRATAHCLSGWQSGLADM
jgi:hypothetical protein